MGFGGMPTKVNGSSTRAPAQPQRVEQPPRPVIDETIFPKTESRYDDYMSDRFTVDKEMLKDPYPYDNIPAGDYPVAMAPSRKPVKQADEPWFVGEASSSPVERSKEREGSKFGGGGVGFTREGEFYADFETVRLNRKTDKSDGNFRAGYVTLQAGRGNANVQGGVVDLNISKDGPGGSEVSGQVKALAGELGVGTVDPENGATGGYVAAEATAAELRGTVTYGENRENSVSAGGSVSWGARQSHGVRDIDKDGRTEVCTGTSAGVTVGGSVSICQEVPKVSKPRTFGRFPIKG